MEHNEWTQTLTPKPTVEVPSLLQFLVLKHEEFGLKMTSKRSDGSECQYKGGDGHPDFQVFDWMDGEVRTTVLRLFIKDGVVPPDIPPRIRYILASYYDAMKLWLDSAPTGQRNMPHKIDLRYAFA